MKTHTAKWWSVDIPDTWQIEPARDYVRFAADAGVSMRVTCLRKERGITSEAELEAYAVPFLGEAYGRYAVSTLGMVGFVLDCPSQSGTGSRQIAYLGSGRLMFIVTAEVSQGKKDEVKKNLETLLAALKPNDEESEEASQT